MFTLFSNLNKLEHLYFSENKITALPPSIINLKNIKTISYPSIITLSDQQKKYYEWIESSKETEFDEYYDDNLVKFAGKF